MNSTQSIELEPWIIVEDNNAQRSPALWRVQANDSIAVALFSDRDSAEVYATANYSNPCQIIHPSRTDLLRVLVECFRQGVRYAALDPGATQTRRIFELRQVLAAAREELNSI